MTNVLRKPDGNNGLNVRTAQKKHLAPAATISCIAAALLTTQSVSAAPVPAPILDIGLRLRVDHVATVPLAVRPINYASPVVIDGAVHVVDQSGARLLRRNGTNFTPVIEPADVPADLTLVPVNGLVNAAAAAGGSKMVVAYTSTTLPPGISAQTLPSAPTVGDDPYRPAGSTPAYQVFYQYDLNNGAAKNPTPIAALEVRETNSHLGGGMLALDDGRILFATGDNLPFGLDGLEGPQISSEHVSKILMIDPATGAVDTLAQGVRNVQHLSWVDPNKREQITFADIGGVVAEEVNLINLDTLLDTATVENFGWGRNADGNAREGTFYIGPGQAFTSGEPGVLGIAPEGEAGFLQPFAQWGRTDPNSFVAVSGPVTSSESFDMITAVFGDLPSGELFATIDPLDPSMIAQSVYSVDLVDGTGAEVLFRTLAGGSRPDPRFFQWEDGTAGVMLERTGDLFRLTELAPVPIPSSGLLLGSLLIIGAGIRRQHRRAISKR